MRYFHPPYLNGEAFLQNRPVITSCPPSMFVGNSYFVGVDDKTRIDKVCLIGLPSVTHGISFGQRYVPLDFYPLEGDDPTPNVIAVHAPPNVYYSPPGYYMLFVSRRVEDGEDVQFVPSVARIVRIDQMIAL